MSSGFCDSNGNSPGVEQGPLDEDTTFPSITHNLNVSSNPLPPDSPTPASSGDQETEALNLSSDFLPAESPDRRLTAKGNSNDVTPETLEKMMLEIGEIEDNDAANPTQFEDFRTAIANRDSLIKRLSTNLQHILKEQSEDNKITSILEEEMQSLRSQVRLAAEKAAKNKSYRSQLFAVEQERDDLRSQLNLATAQLTLRSDCLQDKEAELETLELSLSATRAEAENSVVQLELEIAALTTENRHHVEALERLQEELGEQEKLRHKDKLELEKKFQADLEAIENRFEEEQVIELNLLDAELLELREERNELRERLQQQVEGTGAGGGAGDRLELEEEQQQLLVKAEKERLILVEKLRSLEKLYTEESNIRMSLEQNLIDVNSFLDDTQYNSIPHNIRESISRSLRNSENFNLSKGEPGAALPINATQLESDYEGISHQSPAPSETDPSHNQVEALSNESQVIASMKAEHEREMSELRLYFENYCQQTERRYRSEIEDHLANQPRTQTTSQGRIPLSLEISQGQLEFSELESVSPRSLDSANLNSLGNESDGQASHDWRQNSEGLQVPPHQPQINGVKHRPTHQTSPVPPVPPVPSHKDNKDNPRPAEEQRGQSVAVVDNSVRYEEGLGVRDETVSRLGDQPIALPGALPSAKPGALDARLSQESPGKGCCRCAELSARIGRLQDEHRRELDKLMVEHEAEMTQALEERKRPREHLEDRGLLPVDRQGQQAVDNQQSEADHPLTKSDHTGHSVRLSFDQQRDLRDAREAHALEVEEVLRPVHIEQPQTDPQLVVRLERDLAQLAEERDQLRQMQDLMRSLISDLATHYSLSEKQVRFLSDSTFFDSFFEPKSFEARGDSGDSLPTPCNRGKGSEVVSGANSSLLSTSLVRQDPRPEAATPNQSVLSIEELSDLMANNASLLSELENSEAVLSELRRQVQRSNHVLESLEPGSLLTKLSGLLTPPENLDRSAAENFVGLEAGRLEVEKARLELELTAARQRLQELEMSSRISLPRSEVVSGLGGEISEGESNLSSTLEPERFYELRERVSRILSEFEEETPEKDSELVAALGELLMYCDQVSQTARIQTRDLGQQLEAADKQLKATRQFLEEQAQEREAEREEWERRVLALQQQPARAREESVGFDKEVREDGEDQDQVDPAVSAADEKQELEAAVEKICQLREIIRSLETELEDRKAAEKAESAEVEELRGVLAEALLGQQAVQEELELVRNNSTNQDVIDLVEGLKDQLSAKTQELTKHRAAAQHLHDVKAHLRGLQERVVQSTRELNNTVAGGSKSACSSRGSSPLHIHHNGGSFEDIGVGGLEIEEVSRLERKLKVLESAEAATVNRLKALEAEVNRLTVERDENATRAEEAEKAVAALEQRLVRAKEQRESMEIELKELRNHNFEDLQAENSVLQERVVSLQVQVSRLEGERQAIKHRMPSTQGIELAIREKEALQEEVHQSNKRTDAVLAEKAALERRCTALLSKVDELEQCLAEEANTTPPPPLASTAEAGLRRDKAELEAVNQKLLQEVAQARAAELAAHKVKMPKLAEDLLREKNLEIDGLKAQLSELAARSANPLHSTPNSWASSVSKQSVEMLREAPAQSSHLPDLSFVLGRREAGASVGKSSAPNLDPIQEFPNASVDLRLGATAPGHVDQRPVSCVDGAGGEEGLGETQPSGSLLVDSPEIEMTRRTEQDRAVDVETSTDTNLQDLLDQRLDEIETLCATVKQKESQIFDLEDQVNDMEIKLSAVQQDCSEKERLRLTAVEELNAREDSVAELSGKLADCQAELQLVRDNALKDASPDFKEEVKRLREELSDRVEGMQNLHAILNKNELELQTRSQTEQDLRIELSSAEQEVVDLKSRLEEASADRSALQSSQASLEARIGTLQQERDNLQTELATVRKEMASIERVVKEMTEQFKKEVQARDAELERLKSDLATVRASEHELSARCKSLEVSLNDVSMQLSLAQTQLSTKELELVELKKPASRQEAGAAVGHVPTIEVGSLDDLTSLVQRELDISSELDQTLLNQLVSGNSSLNTTERSGATTEVQRLVRKVQQDGVRVLSLSERVFLTQHTSNEERDKTRSGEKEQAVRESDQKVDLLRLEVDRERFLSQDLRQALDSEKRNALETISKLSRERELRSELEEQLSSLQRQVRILNKEKAKTLPSLVDSDQEEFLHTIHVQKTQIESLEESLRMERENFSQLQNVLAVERQRGSRREESSSSEERRNEEDIAELRNQLRSERSYREQLEAGLGTGKSGEVAKLIIGRLHSELETERRKNWQLTGQLDKEKKKRDELSHDLKRQRKVEPVEESADEPDMDESWTRVWRARELELERLVAELEMKVEMLQAEEGRARQQAHNLQLELNFEKENKSGLSADQLERMRQVNSFLEHNLKENGEMLSTITRLQEERQELKARLGDASRRLESCSCSPGTEDKASLYSKFLRAESYRKALIWQKRYLLVQLSGGYFEQDPVLKVGPQSLTGSARFRAAVHAVISVKRMRFLVARWRSGKRSGQQQRHHRAYSAVRPSPLPPDLQAVSRSSSVQRRPDTLSLHSPLDRQKPLHSPRMVDGSRQPRSGLRRSASLREKPLGRSLESPSSVSSTSSIFHPPVITGRTPPTRDISSRSRQVRASDPGDGEHGPVVTQSRRSLGGEFKEDGGDIGQLSSALQDPKLAEDLKDYLDKYQSLGRRLGVKF